MTTFTPCDVCGAPATTSQRNTEDRVSTFRCDDHQLHGEKYHTCELRQTRRVRLASTQLALHSPGRMF